MNTTPEEFTENRKNLRAFIDGHILKEMSREEKDALMGIASEADRLQLEVNKMRATVAQLWAEIGDLTELKALRASVVLYIRSGAYHLEQSQGLWNGQPLAWVVQRYLERERTSIWTRLSHALGRGVR